MSLKVSFTGPARHDLRRLDKQTAARIIAAIERFAENQQGDVKRLRGEEPEYRLRAGDWRVRFTLDHERDIMEILRVLPRGRAYHD